MIAWTPPEAQRGMGLVLLPPQQALKPLTLDSFRAALAARINRLVEQEDPEDAQALLRQVRDREGLRVPDLSRAGEVLVDQSQALSQAAAFPLEPIPPPFKDDPESKAALEGETLEEFLASLYSEHRE